MRYRLEVADIVRAHRREFLAARHGHIALGEYKVLNAIERCRTAALGGHVATCTSCGNEEISYNSCRNRHCPKCLGAARKQWLAAREQELLPVPYFHVVFTVPRQLAPIARQNKRVFYGLMFDAAWAALRDLTRDPKYLGAEIGVLAVLHTWGQSLEHHPHIHCVVTGGGIGLDQSRWIAGRPGFFLPVRVLGALFRGKLLSRLKRAFEHDKLVFAGALGALSQRSQFHAELRPLYCVPWVVYAKRPFGGPHHVLKYLARYTHRVAISNSRLVEVKDGRVFFHWKDYARQCRSRIMSLSAVEFLRRFLLHVLPKGFKRIRQYGILANRTHRARIAQARRLLEAVGLRHQLHQAAPPEAVLACRQCGATLIWRILPAELRTLSPQYCDTS